MKIFMADVVRDVNIVNGKYFNATVVGVLCVDKGEYNRIKINDIDNSYIINGHAEALISLIMKQRPDKVVFSDSEMGKRLTKCFLGLIKERGMKLEDNGTIVY